MITPIFTVITEVWSLANRAMVRNNSNAIIKVVLINVMLIEGFLYIDFEGVQGKVKMIFFIFLVPIYKTGKITKNRDPI